MAKQAYTITTTGRTFLGTVLRRNDAVSWFGTFFAYGTFGGTTVNWQWSPDGGVTFLPLTDLGGNIVTSTSNASFNGQFGTSKNNSDHPLLYVNLVSGSSISIIAGFYDNQ